MKKVQIPKKSGGTRTVYVQGHNEKRQYRVLAVEATLVLVAARTDPNPDISTAANAVHGFVPGRSPATNAAAHLGAAWVLSADLKDFFDHCTPERIRLGATMAGAKWPDAQRYCVDGAARQGLSSSPAAANLAALPIDRALIRLCGPAGITYTRYADDLTFSGPDRAALLALREMLPSVVAAHGQELNLSKTRLQDARYGRPVVTGVALGASGVVAPRKVRRRSRAASHKARRGGWWRKACARGLEEWCALKFPADPDKLAPSGRPVQAWVRVKTAQAFSKP